MYRFKKIGDLVDQVIEPIAQKQGFCSHKIIKNWPHIVGSQLSKFCAPYFGQLKKNQSGLFIIAVSNPGFIAELQLAEPMIIERLALYYGYKAISKIKIKVVPKI